MRTLKKTTETSIDLDRAIARRLRTLREAAGIPREFVALAARQWGVEWTAGTLALIEDGRRRLSLAEFFMLPTVLNTVIPVEFRPVDDNSASPVRQFTLDNLLPAPGAQRLAVTPHLFTYPDALRLLIRHHGVMGMTPGGQLEEHFDRPRSRELQLYDEVALPAAHALKVPMAVVVRAVEQLWKQSMTQKRDSLVKNQLRARKGEQPSPRQLQALRGDVARDMLKELRLHLDVNAQPSARRTRTSPKRPKRTMIAKTTRTV